MCLHFLTTFCCLILCGAVTTAQHCSDRQTETSYRRLCQACWHLSKFFRTQHGHLARMPGRLSGELTISGGWSWSKDLLVNELYFMLTSDTRSTAAALSMAGFWFIMHRRITYITSLWLLYIPSLKLSNVKFHFVMVVLIFEVYIQLHDVVLWSRVSTVFCASPLRSRQGISAEFRAEPSPNFCSSCRDVHVCSHSTGVWCTWYPPSSKVWDVVCCVDVVWKLFR